MSLPSLKWLFALSVAASVAFGFSLRELLPTEDLVAFCTLVALLPSAIKVELENRRARKVWYYFPDFLSDLAKCRKTGLPIMKCVEQATGRNYGHLTKELQRLLAMLKMGYSLSESLEHLASNLKARSVRLYLFLLEQSILAGGSDADLLETLANSSKEIRRLEEQRRNRCKPLMFMVYLSFFVFLAIAVVINSVAATQHSFFAAEDLEAVKFAMFTTAYVLAISSGVFIGVLMNGDFRSGLVHICANLAVLMAGMKIGGW